MKFTTKTKKVPGTYTRDGKTIPVTRTQTTTVPAFPRDWHRIAIRSAVSIVIALTIAAIAWSTWSIGSLLSGSLGYIVAVIFDISWIVCLILEYLARHDEEKRKFPNRLGWVLLALTMGAIFWHGMVADNVPMAVVGAFASAFAKAMWIAVMKHVNADLTDDDKAWMKHEISAAQTKAAIAQVRRQAARTEQRAALELMAMEAQKREVAEAFGVDLDSSETAIENSRPVAEITPPTLADMGKSDAIRFVRNQRPDAEAEEIAAILADHEVDARPEYVRQVLSRSRKPELETVEDPEEAEIIELRK